MLKLLIDNIYITLKKESETDEEYENLKTDIHETLDPLDPDRYHSALYRRKIWDGRVKLCIIKKDEDIQVPTGLFDELVDKLNNFNVNYTPIDMRGHSIKPIKDIPDTIKLSGEGVKTIEARDYQVIQVKEAITEQRGVILSATASGKTAIFYILAKYLSPTLGRDEKFLFIAPNTTIMNQVFSNIKSYLPNLSIGRWGDSKKELNTNIICATIQTINAATTKPVIKLTSDKDRRLKRLATVYYDKIIDGSSYYKNLKLFVNNFRPTKKTEIKDLEELKNLYFSLDSNMGVKKYFEQYKKRYAKLAEKKAGKKLDKYKEGIKVLDSIRVVVTDECHIAGSKTYQEAFSLMPNARMRIGLTGTLDKEKKIRNIQIKAVLGGVIGKQIKDKDMMDRGFIAIPHIFPIDEVKPAMLEQRVDLELKRLNVPKSQVDLRRYQVAYDLGVIHNEHRNKLVANLTHKILSNDEAKAVLIIVNSIEHGELIQDKLKDLGITAVFLQGKDNSEIRESVISDIKQGKQKVLIGTTIMDEGVDIPNFRYFISCSAGKSYNKIMQRIGRVVRLQEDKKDVFIFDIVDRTHRLLYNQAITRFRYYKQEGFDIVDKK